MSSRFDTDGNRVEASHVNLSGSRSCIEKENKKDGVLVPLKTTLEVGTRNQVVSVWVVGVHFKNASGTLRLVQNLIPDDAGMSFYHLRRFAKLEEVPESVRTAFADAETRLHRILVVRNAGTVSATSDHVSLHQDATVSLPLDQKSKGSLQGVSPANEPRKLLMIAGSVNQISKDELTNALLSVDMNPNTDSGRTVISIPVPLLAPTSASEATNWTRTHWPTVYKKSNPFGPHPSIVSRAQAELESAGEASRWMHLAWDVAQDAEKSKRGEGVGAVVVERAAGGNAVGKLVAVAGDARWLGLEHERGRRKFNCGNVAAHAVLRAISLVADGVTSGMEKRRQSRLSEEDLNGGLNLVSAGALGKSQDIGAAVTHGDSHCVLPESEKSDSTRIDKELAHSTSSYGVFEIEGTANERPSSATQTRNTSLKLPGFSIFRDYPLCALEREHVDPNGNADGYLCHELEIYCTHEPCVMCSMAIVHSRFGRVVFERRMPGGGLCADGQGLRYGLFWRKELNWTLLAWQWQPDSQRLEQQKGTGKTEFEA